MSHPRPIPPSYTAGELTSAARLPAELLSRARVLPERGAILPLLPKGKVFVEIGVALGDWSQAVLDGCRPSQFIAIDSFRLHDIPTLWGRPTAEIFAGRSHAEHYRARFAAQVAAGSMRVIESDSVPALEALPDHSLDIVYVDADHTYPCVKRELEVIRRKIRADGLIVMNDYIMRDVVGSNAPLGVVQATHEFMLAEGWEMAYLALQDFLYCDVVLRRSPGGSWARALRRLGLR